MKKIFILTCFLLIQCNESRFQTVEPQRTSESPKNHRIILSTNLKRGESITVSYSPLYADNIIYSRTLSREGDCLEMKSNYFNAILITSRREELCDNVDAIQNLHCFGIQLTILSKREGLSIEMSSSLDPSYDKCEPFVTDELERRMRKLNDCTSDLTRYDPNKPPVSQSEYIQATKDCVRKARGD